MNILIQRFSAGGLSQFLTYVINGISLGSVYAIIALGYTMVWRNWPISPCAPRRLWRC